MFASAILAAGAAALHAQEEDVVRPPAVRNLGDPPEPAPPARTQDAEITRILAERPAVPVSTPVGAKPAAVKPVLPVEGSVVLNRRCRLEPEPQTHWQILKFLDGDAGARRALPCRYLEVMEQVVGKQLEATFIVSGEEFNCDGKPYLLLQKVLIVQTPSPASAPTDPAPAPARRAATATAASRGAAGSRVDDVVSQMLGSIRKPLLQEVPQPQTQNAPSVAPAGGLELPAEENTAVADRLVRILPEPGTDWYVASFESDNTLQEPPYRILPGRLLEEAVKAAAQLEAEPAKGINALTPSPRLPAVPRTKGKQVVLPPTTRCKVSGEIKAYQGHKYLVLRKRLPDRDMGQF